MRQLFFVQYSKHISNLNPTTRFVFMIHLFSEQFTFAFRWCMLVSIRVYRLSLIFCGMNATLATQLLYIYIFTIFQIGFTIIPCAESLDVFKQNNSYRIWGIRFFVIVVTLVL